MKKAKYLLIVFSILIFAQCKKETADILPPTVEAGEYNPEIKVAIGTLKGTVNVYQYGHVWDTTPIPDSTLVNPLQSVFFPTSNTSTDVTIISLIDGLPPDDTYYIRAYAIDVFGNIFFSEAQIIYEYEYVDACFTASSTECELGSCFIAFDASCSENATEYRWDFDGDGLFELVGDDKVTVSNEYNEIGVYRPILEVVSSNGIADRDTLLIQVSEGLIPVPCFTINTPEVVVGEIINFDASCSENAAEYMWDFGDGGDITVTTNPVVSYIYTSPDIYEVRLTVQAINGGISNFFIAPIQVIDLIMPFACFQINQGVVQVDEAVFFDPACSEDAVSYRWDFNGDGEFDLITADMETVSYVYTSAGNYFVRLEVESATGTQHTVYIAIQVVN